MGMQPLLLRTSRKVPEDASDRGPTVEDFPPAVVELVVDGKLQISSRFTKANQETTDDE